MALSSTRRRRAPRRRAWWPCNASSRADVRVVGVMARPSTSLQASSSADGVTGLVSNAPTVSLSSSRRRRTSSRPSAVTIITAGIEWRRLRRWPRRRTHSTPSRPGIFQSRRIRSKGWSVASACSTWRMASRPPTAEAACIPNAALIAASTSRAQALSSTTSTRRPCRPWPRGATAASGSVRHPNGSSKRNRLPTPGLLDTSISPPIMRTRCWLIDSPRPVPP